MALLNFPSSPTNGQVYTSENGVSYQYNGTFWSAINTSYATGGFTKLDNISSGFNGSNTTFNLTAAGVPVTPGTAQNLIITIGGVTQEPANAYTVSTSSITFTSAPTSGMTFSGVMLGAVMNLGVPSDSTVTSAKLDSNIAVSANLSYGGTLTGSTGVLNIGSGQIYKDASGNLGLGVTPSGWGSGFSAFQAGNVTSLYNDNNNNTIIARNAYRDSVGNKYIISSAAQRILFNNDGSFVFGQAPSGTAGNAISFTQAMTLDASGSLFVGTTSSAMSSPKLDVSGSRATDGVVQFENNVNTGDVNHGILNLINTATGAAGNDARIMFSFRQVGATTGLDPMASLGAIKESGTNAAAIQFNTRSGSGTYSEKARIDSSGRLTVPNQPAFEAIPPASYSLVGGDQIISGTWSEVIDRNNNFNPSNGTFTAPVAGFYHFTWAAFVTCNSTRNDSFISVNGAIKARTEINGYAAGTTNRSSMISVSTYLAANDNVTVGVMISGTGSTYTSQSPWGRFTGFLVG